MDPVPKEKTLQGGLTKNALFLFKLWLSTYQALVDNAGSDRALQLIRPYMKFHFDAGAQIGKEKIELKTDDLYSLAAYRKYGTLFSGYVTGNHQFFEHGYIADILYCPFAHLSEAQCQLMKYILEINPVASSSDYDFIYTKMLVRGDPYCQIMEKKKGKTIWGEVEKKTLEVKIPEISYEELEYMQCAIYSQQWIYATNALVDFAEKEKAVEILCPYMKALGISIANDLSKELGIKDRDALAMASIIDRCNQAANQKGSYTYRTPERADKEITECIFSNASQDICADALEARANGICEAINPLYEFHLTKRMCKGDKVCHWVVMKR